MKKLLALVVSLLIGTSIVFAYTTTVRVNGVGLQVTTKEGRTIQIIPKLSEISGWNVVSGNTTVTNNEFVMPKGDVEIEAIIEESVATYDLTIETPIFTKTESYEEGKSVTVEAVSNEEYEFLSWIANGITLTEEQKSSSSITFTMPNNAVTLEAICEIITLNWDTAGQLTKTLKLRSTDTTIIDWGDGTIETYATSPNEEQSITHTYIYDQNYAVKLGGDNNITYFDCTSSQVSALDVSKATALTFLDCPLNNITALDVSNNLELKLLGCGCNKLSQIDVSNNTELTFLSFAGNNISSIDLSKNTKLQTLYTYSNDLTSLDISKNTNLKVLLTSYNNFTELDISNNTTLSTIACYQSSLSTLYVNSAQNSMNKIYSASSPSTFEANTLYIHEGTSVIVK